MAGGGQYDMRSVPETGTSVADRPSLADAASTWLADHATGSGETESDAGIVPAYIVATAGGGSWAAYWTVEVLDWLSSELPGFDEHLFAISGVSGSSVGAVAHLAGTGRGAGTGDPKDPPETQAHAMLRSDFLAAPLLGLFLRDLPARLIPVADLRPADCGIMLETAWEQADNAVDGAGRWSQPFLSLWADDARPWPALFLNGTEVQNGRRIVTTNLAIRQDPGFVDMTDLLVTTGRDVWASTAANSSARFPIVGPAALVGGKQPDDHAIQVVDGGYFENFGATTAREVLEIFWATAQRRARQGRRGHGIP